METMDTSPPTTSRLSDTVDRAYRRRSYYPARYYLTWFFVMALGAAIGDVVAGLQFFFSGGLELLEPQLWYLIPSFLASLFLVVLSTYFGMIGNSLHLILGDRGIFSLGTVPATAPVITQASFVCETELQKSMYDAKFAGATIRRHMLWRWGRKGGCENWPGAAGGKAEGYWAAVMRSWEDAVITDEKGQQTIEPIEWVPCPRCNRENRTKAAFPDRNANAAAGFVKIAAPTPDEIARMAQDSPGQKRGGAFDIRRQIMANRRVVELPMEVAEAISEDAEFRKSSRVDVGYDPLPDEDSFGMVLPSNGAIELFGLQDAGKTKNDEVVALHQTIAVVHQLRGGLSGTGQQ